MLEEMREGDPFPPVFMQVSILKAHKLLCFHTLLQVLILKKLTVTVTDAQREAVGISVPGSDTPELCARRYPREIYHTCQ